MSAAVIVLIIIGLVFIFLSYFFAEKLEQKDDGDIIRIPDKLSEEQKQKIKKLIDDYMDENVDAKLSDIEDKLAGIVNEKTLALGDYAVSVNEEIERNHSEVLFLYSMLSDKQKEIMTTANMVDEYRKDVENFVNNAYDNQLQSEEQSLEEAIREIDENIEKEKLKEAEEAEEPMDANKDIILEMHKSGLSILEIAKQLGLGVGEVKLVVDLYRGAK